MNIIKILNPSCKEDEMQTKNYYSNPRIFVDVLWASNKERPTQMIYLYLSSLKIWDSLRLKLKYFNDFIFLKINLGFHPELNLRKSRLEDKKEFY